MRAREGAPGRSRSVLQSFDSLEENIFPCKESVGTRGLIFSQSQEILPVSAVALGWAGCPAQPTEPVTLSTGSVAGTPTLVTPPQLPGFHRLYSGDTKAQQSSLRPAAWPGGQACSLQPHPGYAAPALCGVLWEPQVRTEQASGLRGPCPQDASTPPLARPRTPGHRQPPAHPPTSPALVPSPGFQRPGWIPRAQPGPCSVCEHGEGHRLC